MTRMTDHDLRAYLGDFYDDTTDEQRAAIIAAGDLINERYDGDDEDDSRRGAFSAAVQVILGDATLPEVSSEWKRVRSDEVALRAALTGAIIAAREASPYSVSEQELAEHAGVARGTVRKALGKS